MRVSPRRSGLLFRVARKAVLGCEAIAITALLGLFFVVAVHILMRGVFDVTGSAVNLMIPGAIEPPL